MLTQLEKAAQRLSAIVRIDDVAALTTILRDRSADELSRTAAFHRLVELNQMNRGLAAGIRSNSGRLQRIALQYLASLPPERSYLRRILGSSRIPPHGAARKRGAVRTSSPEIDPGATGASPAGWREQAASDPSPAIRRLSLLRD